MSDVRRLALWRRAARGRADCRQGLSRQLAAGFLAGISSLVAACSGEPTEAAAARALVSEFERALHRGDRATLREVVTTESRPAIDAMALAASADKKPLTFVDATHRVDGLHVRVLDPNADDRPGAFVVVRENGALRLDLVATAGLSARDEPLPGPAQRTVVRPLSPADRARAAAIAARTLAPDGR